MNIILVYVSPNTTTRKITETLKAELTFAGHSVVTLNIGENGNRDFRSINYGLFDGADLLGIGSPVYHLTLADPMERFLRVALPEISWRNPGLKAFTYFTYSGITTGKAFADAVRILRKNRIGFVGAAKIKAPHFYDISSINSFPDDSAAQTVRSLCRAMADKGYRLMDRMTINTLFAHRKSIVNILYPFRHIVGRLRELPIDISAEQCIRCGKCSRECPVGAIEMKDAAVRNPKACICCYHCATCCPRHAVICPTEKIQDTVKLNKKIVGTEDPANDVYV